MGAGGAVHGSIFATTGNVAFASYAGAAAESATEEVISYASGEKELNWDNVKGSAQTVVKDTAVNGTINYAINSVSPTIKPPVAKTAKEAVQYGKSLLKDSPREFAVNTITNIASKPFNGSSNKNNQSFVSNNNQIGYWANLAYKQMQAINQMIYMMQKNFCWLLK